MNLKRWIWSRRMQRKVRSAKRVLGFIDRRLEKMGCPAWKRQQIRRDIITSDKAWINFVDLLEVKK